MVEKQPDALRLADDLQSAVQAYPQMSEDEPGGYCRQEDQLMDDAAAELRRLYAENEKLLAVLEEAEYALDYATDMTKPEGLSGCDCPICTASIRIGEVLAGKRRQA